ncbi:hypothetical protein [Pseudomonas sp. NBRC 111125]|uniref:hypothetical protein n=1 Tax=Pseudomonas sp. NBRC 111125 TaxID=1661040 RepID=UPI0007611B75|nr:hypothetical protein [Pseudomonas sp. NBRC 111125]
MALDKQTPKLALVKGGAEPVLEALAQRAAQQSGRTAQQLIDSTYSPSNNATPGRPSYDDLHAAVDEAHAMVSLISVGLRMIAAGHGTAVEVRKLAKSSVNAAEATKGYLGLVLEAVASAEDREE